jgi:hypothetical protein
MSDVQPVCSALRKEKVKNTGIRLPMNWPYVVAVGLVSTTAIGFMVWQITAQTYRPWAHGMPIGRGWNWPIVITWDAVLIGLLSALFWKIYCDAHTELGIAELCRPSILGIRRILWSEIVWVDRVGFGYHVCSKDKKIVLYPYAYRDPDSVIAILRTRIENDKGNAVSLTTPAVSRVFSLLSYQNSDTFLRRRIKCVFFCRFCSSVSP